MWTYWRVRSKNVVRISNALIPLDLALDQAEQSFLARERDRALYSIWVMTLAAGLRLVSIDRKLFNEGSLAF